MRVGIYTHGVPYLAAMLDTDIRRKGVEVINSFDFCLCRYTIDEYLDEDLAELAIIHPADDDSKGCWTNLKRIVEEHTDSEFYIFAFGRPKREEGIGQHDNVHYMNESNMPEMLIKVVEEALKK